MRPIASEFGDMTDAIWREEEAIWKEIDRARAVREWFRVRRASLVAPLHRWADRSGSYVHREAIRNFEYSGEVLGSLRLLCCDALRSRAWQRWWYRVGYPAAREIGDRIPRWYWEASGEPLGRVLRWARKWICLERLVMVFGCQRCTYEYDVDDEAHFVCEASGRHSTPDGEGWWFRGHSTCPRCGHHFEYEDGGP